MFTLRTCPGHANKLTSAFQRRVKLTKSLEVRFRPLSPSAPARTVDAEAEETVRRSFISSDDECEQQTVSAANTVAIDSGTVAPSAGRAPALEGDGQAKTSTAPAEAEVAQAAQALSSEVRQEHPNIHSCPNCRTVAGVPQIWVLLQGLGSHLSSRCVCG